MLHCSYHYLTLERVSKIHSSFPPFPDILSQTLLSFSVVPTLVSVEDTEVIPTQPLELGDPKRSSD